MSFDFPEGHNSVSPVGFGEAGTKPNTAASNNRLITIVALACIALIATLIYLEVKYHVLSGFLLLMKMSPLISFVCTLCAIGAVICLIIYFSRPKGETTTQQRNQLNAGGVGQDTVSITEDFSDESCLAWYEAEYPDNIEEQKQKYRGKNSNDRAEYLRCSRTYVEFLEGMRSQLVQRPPAVNRDEDRGIYAQYTARLGALQRKLEITTRNNQLLREFVQDQATRHLDRTSEYI